MPGTFRHYLDVSIAPRALAPSIAVTAALSLGGAVPRVPPGRLALDHRPGPVPAQLAETQCALGSLPDGDACVRLPDSDESSGPRAESEVSAHHDKHGRWVVYDQIPRRPDRPADYDLYLYPVPCERGCVVSGYDLDLPDERQRRGRRLSHVGHGAVDLPGKKGTPIVMVPLEHQEGDADVIYVGSLFGTTVVTRHTLRDGPQVREYILLFSHLEAPAAGLRSGVRVKVGEPIGTVGDTGSPELVHLHLETRRVRDGVDVAKLTPQGLVANENTVVCDPRNVLPLR
jgi:murein DD-endopeptidase MepM/ murein hydrolase activator NlpD